MSKPPVGSAGPGVPGESLAAPRFAWSLGLVFVLALSLRLVYLNQMDRSIYFNILKMEGTDCFIFWKWALEIIEKDFLGQGVYHQSPLYPYFLAAIFKLFGANLYLPRLVQMTLGSVTCVMIAQLGRRAGGPAAGVFAGLFAAVYGPFILYDGAILRENLIVFLNTLLVLLMFRAQERPSFARGAVLGLVFGLAVLAKENILILLPGLAVWGWLIRKTSGGNRAGRVLAGMGLAAGLILGLLVARNLRVGAPAWAISSRGPLELISGNVPHSPGVGWVIPENAGRILAAADGKMSRVLWEVLRENRSHPGWLVRHQLHKFLALLNSYEVPNNLSLYVEQRYVPFFRFPWPGFAVALALGLLGMVQGLPRWRELFPLYAFPILFTLATVAFYILARFRLPLIPALIAWAGAAAAMIGRELAAGRRRRGIAWLMLAAALIALNRPWPADRLTVADYQNLARYHQISGQPERAQEILHEGIRRTRQILAQQDRAEYRFRLAKLLLLADRPPAEVLPELDHALQLHPPLYLRLSLEALRRQLTESIP